MKVNFAILIYAAVLYMYNTYQGSKIALVRSYLRVPKAAGQVDILIFLVKKIKIFPYMPIIFVMQGKCPFSDISRPAYFAITYMAITDLKQYRMVKSTVTHY